MIDDHITPRDRPIGNSGNPINFRYFQNHPVIEGAPGPLDTDRYLRPAHALSLPEGMWS